MTALLEWLAKYAGYITAICGALGLILVKPVRAAVKRRKEREAAEKQFRAQVLEKLDAITDDVADLQYERLSQAHDFYTSRGWCPTSKKAQLCNMYKSYTAKGRNHLSQHYEKEILSLADDPQAEN